jgi:putative endonuclease
MRCCGGCGCSRRLYRQDAAGQIITQSGSIYFFWRELNGYKSGRENQNFTILAAHGRAAIGRLERRIHIRQLAEKGSISIPAARPNWGFFMLYTVYILFSAANQRIYIGYTSNLITRFRSHNQFGKEWTAAFRPWQVVYCEYFANRAEAARREKQLKSAAARAKIWMLLRKDFEQAGYITGL